jgi:hypothetical protein
MSWQATTAVIEKSMQKGSARLMMLVLGNYADKFGFAWPGVRTVAADTRLSERNIQYLLGKAVASGELEVFRNAGPVMPRKRQRTNLFHLTLCESPPPEHPYFGIKEWCKDCTTPDAPGGATQRQKVVQESLPGGASQREKVAQGVAPDPSDGTVIEPSVNEGERGKPRTPAAPVSNGHRKAKTLWPENFQLTPEMTAYASGLGIDAEAEFEAWRDRCANDGERNGDWFARWRIWVRRAVQLGTNRKAGAPRLSPGRQEAANGKGDSNPYQTGAGERLKREQEAIAAEDAALTPKQREAAREAVREIIRNVFPGDAAKAS